MATTLENTYQINWKTQEIYEIGTDGEIKKKVFQGLDRNLTAYGDDYFQNDENKTNHNKGKAIYDRLPWSQSLTRAYNIPDGIFISVFYSEIFNEWIISTTGEHTMRILDGDEEYHINETLWGEKATFINISDSPFWSDIKEIMVKAKFNSILSIFKKEYCYTFILSSPKVRTTGPIASDMPGREDDLGFGIFHFITRDCSNDFVEINEILLGVRQPLIRALKDKQDCIDQINMCGPTNTGIIVSEILPSRGRLSCRKAFFFNCVWTKVFYLNQVEGIERREMCRTESGDLTDNLTDEEILLLKENEFFSSLLTEFIVYNEIGVIQSYISLREKYLRFILYIYKKMYHYINEELLLGITDSELKQDMEEKFLNKDVSEILKIIL